MKVMDVFIESFRITREKKKYDDLSLSPEVENQIKIAF